MMTLSASLFNRINYVERKGSGFKKIKSDYRKEVNYKENLESKFYSDSTSFKELLSSNDIFIVTSRHVEAVVLMSRA